MADPHAPLGGGVGVASGLSGHTPIPASSWRLCVLARGKSPAMLLLLLIESVARKIVIPAQTGIHLQISTRPFTGRWIPAFAGMTGVILVAHSKTEARLLSHWFTRRSRRREDRYLGKSAAQFLTSSRPSHLRDLRVNPSSLTALAPSGIYCAPRRKDAKKKRIVEPRLFWPSLLKNPHR